MVMRHSLSKSNKGLVHTLCLCCLQARRQLLRVLLPLLKLLANEEVRTDPSQSNPVLATLHDSLQLAALNAALQDLSSDAAAGEEGYIRKQLQQPGGMVSVCI
jgi:hypothetical protein